MCINKLSFYRRRTTVSDTESGIYYRGGYYYSHKCNYGNGLSSLCKATASVSALGLVVKKEKWM